MQSAEHLEDSAHKRDILVVLGPHRSGTSALTGVLSMLGTSLPKHLMPANTGNAAGYFESSRIKVFNDRLLAEIGSSWHDISPLDLTVMPSAVWDSFLEQGIDLLKAEFGDAGTPLLKDPRICRLVDFWRVVFDRCGYRPIYVLTYRNPLETASSLAARHPMSVEVGLLVWLRHVLDAEAATRNTPRAITNYLKILTDWRSQVANIQAATAFRFPDTTTATEQDIDRFLDFGLRHQSHQGEDVHRSPQVSDLVREAFTLLEGAADGLTARDHTKLDVLRERLDVAAATIGPFLQALGRENASRKSLEARVVELEQDNAQINEHRSSLLADLDRMHIESARDRAAEKQQFDLELESRNSVILTLEASAQNSLADNAQISAMLLEASFKLEEEGARRLKHEQRTAKKKSAKRLPKNSARVPVADTRTAPWPITRRLRRFFGLVRKSP